MDEWKIFGPKNNKICQIIMTEWFMCWFYRILVTLFLLHCLKMCVQCAKKKSFCKCNHKLCPCVCFLNMFYQCFIFISLVLLKILPFSLLVFMVFFKTIHMYILFLSLCFSISSLLLSFFLHLLFMGKNWDKKKWWWISFGRKCH